MKYYVFSYNWELVAKYDTLEDAEKNVTGRQRLVYKPEDIKKIMFG